MKSFETQILAMDSKRCENQSELWQIQPLLAGQSVQPRQRFKVDFVYPFTFPSASNAGILTPIFTYLFFKSF
jgi:hypothetical protein